MGLEATELKDQAAGIPSLRNAREAKKGKENNEGKKDIPKRRKKNKRKGVKGKNDKKNNNNGKSVKSKKRRRKAKKNEKKAAKTKKKSAKGKKGQSVKRKSRKIKNGKKKDKKNKNTTRKQKKRGRKSNKKNKKDKKTRKKIKKKSRKAKPKKKSKGKTERQGRLVCGSTQVNDTCLQNAVDSLNFEKNQIQNFFKQNARLKNHNKTKSGKLGKKGEFEDAAKYLSQAIGGNISAPTCGESGTAQKARSAKSASDNYATLLNCSESIKEACTMPKKTYNATVKAQLDACAFIFNKSKTAANDCRTNNDYITNGTAACDCWRKAAIGIVKAKEAGCKDNAADTAKAVKAAKNKCISAFSVCKKAEDAAVGLIHTCMAGEVKNISATGRL